MKKAWIVGTCLVLALSGCSKEVEPEPEEAAEDLVVEEEIPEVVLVEDLDDETFKKVRYHIQDQLMVFDASRFDEGLMLAVKEDVKSGMDRELAKEIVEETLSGYLNMWKREIITESLEFLVGEYSRSDFEKLIENTTNEQIKGMVIAYAIEKLEQEGYQFD